MRGASNKFCHEMDDKEVIYLIYAMSHRNFVRGTHLTPQILIINRHIQ